MEREELKSLIWDAIVTEVGDEEAARLTEKALELHDALKDGVVTFSFTKKDGSERIAKGTLKRDLVPEYEAKTDRPPTKNYGAMTYYDLEKNAFRSFKIVNLIGIV